MLKLYKDILNLASRDRNIPPTFRQLVNVEGDNVEPTVDLHLCTCQDEQVALGVDANESGLGRDRLQNFAISGAPMCWSGTMTLRSVPTPSAFESWGPSCQLLRTANEQAIVGSMHHHRTVAQKQGLQNRNSWSRGWGNASQCHRPWTGCSTMWSSRGCHLTLNAPPLTAAPSKFSETHRYSLIADEQWASHTYIGPTKYHPAAVYLLIREGSATATVVTLPGRQSARGKDGVADC